MKTFTPLAIIAAPLAFVLFPLSFEVSVSLAFGAGMAAIMLADYSRTSRRGLIPVRATAASSRKERFGLAA